MIKVLLITQAGTKLLSIQKRQAPEKRDVAVKRTVVTALKTEANTQTVAKEPTSESSTPSWASDHNYNAVKPEKTPAIASSQLFKCMYLTGIFLCSHFTFSLSTFPLADSAQLAKGFPGPIFKDLHMYFSGRASWLKCSGNDLGFSRKLYPDGF